MKKTTISLLVLFSITLLSCTKKQYAVIDYSNPYILYEGRMDTTDGVNLYWSGSSIKLKFKGTNISALLNDERGDNYYNVIIDGEVKKILRADSTKQYYKLAEGLSNTEHTLELFKRTEWDRGVANFYGFKIEGDYELFEIEKPKRKIEFYGNSITAGYAVDDTSGADRSDSVFTNNYLSYAHLTAEHFNARYHCTCKSGIGIMVSWFPTIMPEIFNRINPEDSLSEWNFNNYQPDILILNLFQNDSWLVNMPEHESFIKYFGTEAPDSVLIISAYKNFVQELRNKYPNTQFICMLGNMDITREGSPWPGYIKQAVSKLNNDKILTHFVPYKETPGHPSEAEQQIMAESLIGFIEENVVW